MKFQLGKSRWKHHIFATLENIFPYRQTVINSLSHNYPYANIVHITKHEGSLTTFGIVHSQGDEVSCCTYPVRNTFLCKQFSRYKRRNQNIAVIIWKGFSIMTKYGSCKHHTINVPHWPSNQKKVYCQQWPVINLLCTVVALSAAISNAKTIFHFISLV